MELDESLLFHGAEDDMVLDPSLGHDLQLQLEEQEQDYTIGLLTVPRSCYEEPEPETSMAPAVLPVIPVASFNIDCLAPLYQPVLPDFTVPDMRQIPRKFDQECAYGAYWFKVMNPEQLVMILKQCLPMCIKFARTSNICSYYGRITHWLVDRMVKVKAYVQFPYQWGVILPDSKLYPTLGTCAREMYEAYNHVMGTLQKITSNGWANFLVRQVEDPFSNTYPVCLNDIIPKNLRDDIAQGKPHLLNLARLPMPCHDPVVPIPSQTFSEVVETWSKSGTKKKKFAAVTIGKQKGLRECGVCVKRLQPETKPDPPKPIHKPDDECALDVFGFDLFIKTPSKGKASARSLTKFIKSEPKT